MIVFEYKTNPSPKQISSIEEGIRVARFIRNKSIHLWETEPGVTYFKMSNNCKILAQEFEFVKRMNAQARQCAAFMAWTSVSRFYSRCKSGLPGKKGYPRYKKDIRVLEYGYQSGWQINESGRRINFSDGLNIGSLKLIGTQPINQYKHLIKRVRIIRRADGYCVQFVIDTERKEPLQKSGSIIGVDLGLESFLTDSNDNKVANPRNLLKAEKRLKRKQRQASRKEKGSNNRKKANNKLARLHQKVARQRKDFVVKTARALCVSNDTIVIEDLNVSNMVKNRRLAKSISDAGWYSFRVWLEYFCKVFDRELIVVPAAYTSQACSNCGKIVKKSLSQRTHICECGCNLHRDHNAALNILEKGLSK